MECNVHHRNSGGHRSCHSDRYSLHRGRLEPLEALWSARSGRPIFTAVTSLKWFKSLLRYLSFDNKATMETRRATDKLAAVILQWLQRSRSCADNSWRHLVSSLSMIIFNSDFSTEDLYGKTHGWRLNFWATSILRLTWKLLSNHLQSVAVYCPRSRDRKDRKMCTVYNRNVCQGSHHSWIFVWRLSVKAELFDY